MIDHKSAETSGAYSVGRTCSGRAAWWENWLNPADVTDVRPATMEERALMDKAVWGRANFADLECLREMIK